MPRKPIDINVVNQLWEFYRISQKRRFVIKKAEKANLAVSTRTIDRLISTGYPNRGIVSFRARLDQIEAAAAKVVDAATIHVLAEVAAIDVNGWRIAVDRSIRVINLLVDKAEEILTKEMKGTNGELVPAPVQPKDLTAAANAVKAAGSFMKQAAETHETFKILGGVDADGRDVWLQEHFEEFTPEEHAAFRDDGIWPERIPLPAWMGGEEPQQQTETNDDPTDVLQETRDQEQS